MKSILRVKPNASQARPRAVCGRWPARAGTAPKDLGRAEPLAERQPDRPRTARQRPGRNEILSDRNGTRTLNLGSLVTNLANQVGIGASLAEKLPPRCGQIEILHSNQLKTAQNIAAAVKGLVLLLSARDLRRLRRGDLPGAGPVLGDDLLRDGLSRRASR